MEILRQPSAIALMALVLGAADARADPGSRQRPAPDVAPEAAAGPEAQLAALGPADRWRRLIAGDNWKLPRHERVIVTDAGGRILLQADGSERGVAIPPQWMPRLTEHGAGLILAHNHPNGHSLSLADLSQFEKRGVAMVVVVGHDGSLYAAAEGSRYRDASFAAVYVAASREVERQVRLHKVERNTVLMRHNHLVALALARAGVIVYRADLAPDRWRAYNSSALQCDDIVRAADAKVRQLLGQ
jgi:predicted regulator of Ras-like GTPase activity (Roadblock/LC7/MglB family)